LMSKTWKNAPGPPSPKSVNMTPEAYIDWCIAPPIPLTAEQIANDLVRMITGDLGCEDQWVLDNAHELLRVLRERKLFK
jgi:hypothetical protein